MLEKYVPLDAKLSQGALLAGAVLCVLGYFLSAGTLFDHDPLVMGEVARRVAQGERLYIDAWDNKPPLALLFYWPAQVLAPGSYLAQQLFGGLWTLAQGWITFRLLDGESKLVRTTATLLVQFLPLSRLDFAWASSEDAVNLFTLTLTLLGYRILKRGGFLGWEPFLAGALTVIGFHARQTGLFFVLLPGLAVVLARCPPRDKLRAAALAALGGLLGLALVMSIVLSVSSFAAYIDAVFVGPRRYGTTALGTLHWVLREQLTQARGQMYAVLFLFALFGAPDRRQRLFVAAAVSVALIAVLAPGKPFGHYQEQLIPALVLAVSVCLGALEDQAARLGRAFAAALLCFTLANALLTVEELRNDHGAQAELDEIADLLDAHAHDANATLLAMGTNSAYVYFRSAMRPVHRFHWDLFFDDDGGILPQDAAQVVSAILAQPPAWYVVHKASLKELLSTDAGRSGSARLTQQLEASGLYEPVASTQHYLVRTRRSGQPLAPSARPPVSSGTPQLP